MRHAKVMRLLLLGIAGAAIAAAGPASAAYVGTVIVSGLNSPHGLAFGPDGALYIAEAGYLADDSPSVVIDGGTYRYNTTGSITRYEGGTSTRVVTGLPSLYTPRNDVIGAQDVVFDASGNGYVVVGLGSPPAVRDALGPEGQGLGTVYRFDNCGTTTPVADPAGLEAVQNPDGGLLDSNPFHMASVGNNLLITDAGGNSLLFLDEGGTLSVHAVFPQRDIGGPGPSDSVPTGVVVGPDGNYYVAELTGFPFTEGEARIYRVTPTGEVTVAFDGFTTIVDLAFDDLGNLYVLQLDSNGLAVEGGVGSIIRVGTDGGRQTVFSDLFFPSGLKIGPDGALYVINMSILAGGGQVLRIVEVPEPAAIAILGLGLGGIALARRRRSAPAAAADDQA